MFGIIQQLEMWATNGIKNFMEIFDFQKVKAKNTKISMFSVLTITLLKSKYFAGFLYHSIANFTGYPMAKRSLQRVLISRSYDQKVFHRLSND